MHPLLRYYPIASLLLFLTQNLLIRIGVCSLHKWPGAFVAISLYPRGTFTCAMEKQSPTCCTSQHNSIWYRIIGCISTLERVQDKALEEITFSTKVFFMKQKHPIQMSTHLHNKMECNCKNHLKYDFTNPYFPSSSHADVTIQTSYVTS